MIEPQDLKNKRVIIYGLGQYRYGSGLSAAKFWLSHGAKLIVTDLKTKTDLAQSCRLLDKWFIRYKRKNPNLAPIKYVLGRHEESDFTKADWVMRNPGVPNNSPFLELARRRRVPIDTDISLFFRLCPAKIVGITGTRGKSTTTVLIHKIFGAAFSKVYLGGNILYSPLNFLSKIKDQDWIVLELSSWQTESLLPFEISPHLSVITNLYPDHLNVHKGMAEYARAKEAIFQFQSQSDASILYYSNEFTNVMGKRVRSRRTWFDLTDKFKKADGSYIINSWIYSRQSGRAEKILPIKEIQLLGDHNLLNVLAAVSAARAVGVSGQIIRQAVKDFTGLPNRLEFIKQVKGVAFYNDTTATTAEGTVAAINSFPAAKTVLIAGGAEKKLPFDSLARAVVERVCHLILLDHPAYKASRRLAEEIKKINSNFKVNWTTSMTKAVRLSLRLAKKGDFVIMSPACASFGMFKNEYDRGKKFVKAVKKL